MQVRSCLREQLDKPTESNLRKHTHAKHFFSALAAREKVSVCYIYPAALRTSTAQGLI